MRFKVKDLMITVLPQQGKAVVPYACCTGTLINSCGGGGSICGGCTATCQPCTQGGSACCANTLPASCGPFSGCGGGSGCGASGCGGCTGCSCSCTFDGFSMTFIEPLDPVKVTALKTQLKAAMAQVELHRLIIGPLEPVHAEVEVR